jgi:hypothetical protein
MNIFSWTCAHCGMPTTITRNDQIVGSSDLHLECNDGQKRLLNRYIVCPNPDCKKMTLEVWLHERTHDELGNVRIGDLIKRWQLVPQSSAKSFPDYIPNAIRSDYDEACLVRDLSPKASATLSRRCLQGILRDFWKVKPGRLVVEIESIKDKIDPLVWDSIDTVRKIGNIGAHMEKDINVMVDVEPEEAELLLGLIEMLLREWYVLREERKKRLEGIVKLGAAKQLERRSEP